MLDSIMLEPLVRSLLGRENALGEYGVGLLAREIAGCDIAGFASLIASQLERVP
jgi:hypothetical protein